MPTDNPEPGTAEHFAAWLIEHRHDYVLNAPYLNVALAFQDYSREFPSAPPKPGTLAGFSRWLQEQGVTAGHNALDLLAVYNASCPPWYRLERVQRAPLTIEEIDRLWRETAAEHLLPGTAISIRMGTRLLARAVEAHHGIMPAPAEPEPARDMTHDPRFIVTNDLREAGAALADEATRAYPDGRGETVLLSYVRDAATGERLYRTIEPNGLVRLFGYAREVIAFLKKTGFTFRPFGGESLPDELKPYQHTEKE